MNLHFLPPATDDAYDAAVEDAIATCNGDLRGALKALIIANEFLERDLERALAFDAVPSIAHDGNTGFRHVSWVERVSNSRRRLQFPRRTKHLSKKFLLSWLTPQTQENRQRGKALTVLFALLKACHAAAPPPCQYRAGSGSGRWTTDGPPPLGYGSDLLSIREEELIDMKSMIRSAADAIHKL